MILASGKISRMYGTRRILRGLFSTNMAARKLDRTRLGQTLYTDPRYGELGEAALIRRFGNDRNWFNTARPGSANTGHDFWSRIRTDANRRALIEYLKTL